MTRTGVIREVCPDGYARVEIAMRTACGHSCEDCGGCAPGSRELIIRARNPLEAGPRDTVAVSAGTGKVLGAAALVYVIMAMSLISAPSDMSFTTFSVMTLVFPLPAAADTRALSSTSTA